MHIYLSVLLRTYRYTVICIFIAVQAPIRLFGAKAGHAYTSRECANTFLSITQDIYSNQLDCETVGTQREEHNVVFFFF